MIQLLIKGQQSCGMRGKKELRGNEKAIAGAENLQRKDDVLLWRLIRKKAGRMREKI